MNFSKLLAAFLIVVTAYQAMGSPGGGSGVEPTMGTGFRTRPELLALGLPEFVEQTNPVLLMKENSQQGLLVEFVELKKDRMSYQRIQGNTDGKLYLLRTANSPMKVKLAIVNWNGLYFRLLTLQFKEPFTTSKVYVISGLGHEVYGWAKSDSSVSKDEEAKVAHLQATNKTPFDQRPIKIEPLAGTLTVMANGFPKLQNSDSILDIEMRVE